MTIARRDIVPEGTAGAFHCTVRCVRQARLCGQEEVSGRNYDHRKEWIRDRLRLLAGIFAVDVAGYAAMSNHLHTIVRTDPARAAGWSEAEVARRWRTLCPTKRMRQAAERQPTEAEIAAVVQQPRRVPELRRRLGSLSWFMRCLNEHIARMANREDGCKGRFWEGRYKCRALADEAAMLTALAYVDLNPIRAGVAATPEESVHTSAWERIVERVSAARSEEDPVATETRGSRWLCPISDTPDRRGVFRRLTLDEYLVLLDRAGRTKRPDKLGAIPRDLDPILARLSLKGEGWTEAVRGYESYFRRVVGRSRAVAAAAEAAGRQWFQGVAACRRLLDPP